MLSYCLLVFVTLLTRIQADIVYTIPEEKTKGFFIGKISDKADLHSSVRLFESNIRIFEYSCRTLLHSYVLDKTISESLRYSFLTQGYPQSRLFNLTKDGYLFTSVQLDREDLCGFSDSCVLEAEIVIQSVINQFFRKEKLKVILTDINDNPPIFNKDTIELQISEAVSVNSAFIVESALDRDVGNNSLQGYELVSDSNVFDIRVTNNLDGGTVVSLVISKPLDREIRDSYKISIIAKDGASPPETGELVVMVTVTDINDNPPVFYPTIYNIKINESSAIGSRVARVKATDLDSDTNGVVLYRFSPLVPSEVVTYFKLNGSSGDLTVLQNLHQIQGRTIKFIVECVDGGLPPLVAQAQVTIHVVDSINSAPSIHLNLFERGEVSEDVSPGITVAHVAVRDPDSDQNGLVKCSIISDAFEIQGLEVNEYKIAVARTLDREKTSRHRIILTCRDAGKPPMNDTKIFHIRVRDINDNAPYFEQVDYLGYISENAKPGQTLLTVKALDKDVGENSQIRYMIPSGKKHGVGVNHKGQIISMKYFDREENNMFKFQVFAIDNGQPSKNSSCTVTVIVTDVNDNRPTFPESTYLFKIDENQASGTIIGKIQADDSDEGLNAVILYNIQLRFDELEYYPIKVTTDGLIKTVFPLDREIKSRYEFSVIASDRGAPSMSSSVAVIVEVRDQNDHAPLIVSPDSINQSLAVPYHMHTDYALFTIIAKDGDVDDNARVEYILSPEDGHGIFTIDTQMGVLRLSRFLTAADLGNFALDVVVRDFGNPPLNTTADFNITIYKSNETNIHLEGGSDENTMVVLILGSVTGLICIIVILIIFVIRRSDSARKKFFQANVITHMQPSNFGVDFSTHGTEDSAKTKSNSWDKRCNQFPYADELTALSETSVEQPLKNRPNVSGAWNDALKKHEALLKSYGLSTKVQIGSPILPINNHQEDSGSHTSADTTTNDSGRGGSDDEANLTRFTNIENGPEAQDMVTKRSKPSDLISFKQPYINSRRSSADVGPSSYTTPSTVLINHYAPKLDNENSFTKHVKFNFSNAPWLPPASGSDPNLARTRRHSNLTHFKTDQESCDSEVNSITSDVQADDNGVFELKRQKTDDVYV